MKIYIDDDYKCHVDSAPGRTEVSTDFFDGKAEAFIEGYRFVPQGSTWTDEQGRSFLGEIIAPWKPYEELAMIQSGYKEAQAEMDDMRNALNIMGVNVDG